MKNRININGESLYLNNTRPAGTTLNFLEMGALSVKEINAIYLSYLNVILLGNEILKIKKMNKLLTDEMITDFTFQSFCIPNDVINDLERKKEYKSILGLNFNDEKNEDFTIKTIEELLERDVSKAYALNYSTASNQYLKLLILKSSVDRFSKIFESTLDMFSNFEKMLNEQGIEFTFYDDFTKNIDSVCNYYFGKGVKKESEMKSLMKLYCLFNIKINSMRSKDYFIGQFMLLGIDRFDFGVLNIESKSFKNIKDASFDLNLFFNENYEFNYQLAEAFAQFNDKDNITLIDYYLNSHTIENKEVDQGYLSKTKNEILINYENNKPVLIYAKNGVGKKTFIYNVFKNVAKKVYLISISDTKNLISEKEFFDILTIYNKKNDQIFVFDDICYEKFGGLINLLIKDFYMVTTSNPRNEMILSKHFGFYNINSIPTYVKLKLLKNLINDKNCDIYLKEIALIVKNFNEIIKISNKINNEDVNIEELVKNLKEGNPFLIRDDSDKYFYYSEAQKDKVNKIESLLKVKQRSDNKKMLEIPKGFMFFGDKGNGKNALLNEIAIRNNVPLKRFNLSTIENSEDLVLIKNEILDNSPCIAVFDAYMEVEKLNGILYMIGKLEIDRGESLFIVNTLAESELSSGNVLLQEFKNINSYSQRFYFDYISLSERKEFLKELCQNLLENKDAELLADITEGVDIKGLKNFALSLQYYKDVEEKEITIDVARELLDKMFIGEETTDLYLPIDKTEKENSIYKTAIHEMGHALLALKYKMDLSSISVVSRSYYLGVTRFNTKEFGSKTTLSKLTQRIEVALGGLIAEQLFFNEHELGVAGDMNMVNNMLEVIFSVGQSDVDLNTGDIFVFNSKPEMLSLLSEKDKEEISKRKRKILKDCLLSATKFLKENKDVLEETAKLLKEKRCLYKEDIEKFKENLIIR